MEQHIFPILTSINARNIDAFGNVQNENRLLKVEVSDGTNGNTLAAIMGFAFTLCIMAGLSISYLFFIVSILFLLLFLGFLPKMTKTKNEPSAGNHVYTHFGQEIAFKETGIFVYSEYPHEQNSFFHREISEIKLHFVGITAKNAPIASSIRIITQGKSYHYYFGVDSEGSRANLIHALKRLYKKDIKLTEYQDGQKMYLLGLESDREIDKDVQALIDEIGTKDEKNDVTLL